MYWAQELASQSKDADLQSTFAPFAKSLADNEAKIIEELNSVQGVSKDIDGYYFPNDNKAFESMRPSATLNAAISAL